MSRMLLLSIFTLLITMSCKKEDIPTGTNEIAPLEWNTGKNNYTMIVDSIERQFVIHVPASYDSSEAVPLVIMFHGSGATGEKMYNVTEWVQKSEQEGCIVVFPTALSYFVVDKNKMQTKWSKLGLERQLLPGIVVIDDIPFVRAMLEKVQATFRIDKKRIFGTGFSNGGGFCRTKLAIEMSDIFASLTGAGGWGASYELRTLNPKATLSQHYIMGNKDPLILAWLMRTTPLPMDANTLFEIEEQALRKTVENVVLANGYDWDFQEKNNANNTLITFNKKGNVPQENVLNFHLVKGLLHRYPKPSNNPIDLSGVEIFWKFHMTHIKPE